MLRSIRLALPLLALALLWPAPASAAPGDVVLQEILSGYEPVIQVTHAPSVKRLLFIVEQSGKIKRARLRDGSWRKAGKYLDISDRVQTPMDNLELGLLGVAFHPDYRRNGRLYVAYTRPNGDSVVSEFRRRTARKADPGSERVLMVIPQPNDHHNVANLAFGPDRMLYIGSGDGGPGGDPQGNSRDMRKKLGKILRIDPLDPDGKGGKRFRVPRSNPFVGKPGLDSIWALGLRNPWRFSFDRTQGHLWIADVGQDREEIDRATTNRFGQGAGRGDDYGWNHCEGRLEYVDDEGDADNVCDQGVTPIFEYLHDGWVSKCAVIGGYVHRGPGAKRWRGLYTAGDYCGSLVVLDAQGRPRLWKTTTPGIVSFGEDAIGRIFAVNRLYGTVSRVRFTGERPGVLAPGALKREQEDVQRSRLPAGAPRIR